MHLTASLSRDRRDEGGPTRSKGAHTNKPPAVSWGGTLPRVRRGCFEYRLAVDTYRIYDGTDLRAPPSRFEGTPSQLTVERIALTRIECPFNTDASSCQEG